MHLILPILIDDERYCCSIATRRTEAILSDGATEIDTNTWEIYRAIGDEEGNSGVIYEGRVVFGICCASRIEFSIEGVVETLNPNFDILTILVDGEEEYSGASTQSSEDPLGTETINAFVGVDLEDRPCGHIIEISGSTLDAIANNGVGWIVSISIT